MDLFSISQLSQFSGIKPHTIRMWEQRYGALHPNRSKGNTRYYDGNQLRRLLNIVSLLEYDHRISELGPLRDDELRALLDEYGKEKKSSPAEYFISQLIAAGLEYDESAFDKIFSHCIVRFGLRNSYTRVIYPTLERVGLLWANDKLLPANEHFISNIIRQKLFTSIDSLVPAKENSCTWLLFLPENEFHEIGLLMANYLIRLSGDKTVYLGGNVPLPSLQKAVQSTQSNKLLLFLVHQDLPENIQNYIDTLSEIFPGHEIYLAGQNSLLHQVQAQANIKKLFSVDNLEKQLNVLHEAAQNS